MSKRKKIDNEIPKPPALEVHDLTVAYRKKPVLWGVDFEIPEGKLVGILGPNGAGKSTLIKAAMGLLPLSSGWVEVYGKPLEQNRDRVGYVPQREDIDWDFPVSVMDVVLMGRYGRLGLFKWPQKEDRDIARASLDKVKMLAFADRQISNLSGGQQQRVFLARALAQESDLYLMDEPFAGVDAATEASIIALLRDLREQGKTVFVVHHDLSTVPDYFDWVVLLNARLIAHGPTGDTFTTKNLATTYGGQLTVMAEVAEALRKDEGLNATKEH
jgi:manganese/zinc/iron transport system ATP- binding protein